MQNSVTIKENRDFKRVYVKGRSYVNPGIVVYLLKNKRNINRIGITVAKKTGSAVERNRAKRIIREAYRHIEKKVITGHDIIFVARRKTIYLKSTDIQKIISGIFNTAGVLIK